MKLIEYEICRISVFKMIIRNLKQMSFKLKENLITSVYSPKALHALILIQIRCYAIYEKQY